MKKYYAHLIGLAISALSLGNSMAQSSTNAWEGAYGQIGLIGYESYIPKASSGTTTYLGNTYSNSSTANHANGPAANISVGYNFGINSTYTLGIGASLYPGHSRSASSTASSAGTVSSGVYDVSNVFSFSLLPGYVIDNDRLIYAKIGYAGSNIHASSAGHYPEQVTHVNGTVYGFGYKQIISGSIYAFGEGNYAVNRAKPVTVVTDNGAVVNSTANATGYDFIFGIGYRF
ncbi:hypothetical protein ICN46_04890 [Polynucleobacter sp. Latsch14-2]|jgi:hypothetical protein|uniref:hypothetical protein n=1 Tax=Polynucleobacter sp. Latsch14-2 TaxID=2576920 RepID=UPI001C0C9F6A|nr:hypothetical protein [Polynucleobacter sp. Latsch14-2]MBU3614231.1 hypothetical protein [Polynucleobacter sp. Latsch14-2]